MKNILLLWLGWGVGVTAYAQTLTVLDGETQQPVPLATLISEQPPATAVTNSAGQVNIAAFAPATQIHVRSLGYQPLTLSYAQLLASAPNLLLQPADLVLEEVVVAGTRWQQSSANLPAKVATISARQVALQNPQTAADLLGISGKVYIQKSQQGGGSPMIRGFATNRLLYTVDGVRMNTAIFRGGNIQNVINLDPFATERTEVVFGPGSVIYGSDAIGGVMSFQTLTPQFSYEDKPLITGKAVARYASANSEATGHLDVNLGWNKWALVTSISSWNYDHLRQGSHGPDEYLKPFYVQRQNGEDVVIQQEDPLLQIPTAYAQINLMQKVRFQPTSHWDFQYSFHFSETSPYGRYDRHNRFRNSLPRYARWDYGPQKWLMHNQNTSYTRAHALFDRATLRLAYQQFAESRIERELNSELRTNQAEEVDAYSANLDFTKALGANTLFYGLEYILNDVTSDGRITDIGSGLTVQGPARYPQANWQSVAAYINNEFSATDKLTLVAGLRYNQFRLKADFTANSAFFPFTFTEAELNNGALTGSLGAVFRPTDSWVVSSNLATAFRSPNVDDVGKVFDSEPGAVTVPNPNLQAEYAYNVDLNVAKIFNKWLKVDLSGYYTWLQNALVRRNFTLNGQEEIIYDGELSRVQAIQNAAIARVYGLQFGLEAQLPVGFRFSTDLNLQTGEEELDDGSTSLARHAAPFFGISRLTYQANKLNLQLYTTYQGERSFNNLAQQEREKDEIYAKDDNGNNYAPAWYTLNIKALYPVSDGFSLSAGLENITDQRYRPYSSGVSGAGRNFILSLRAEF